LTKNIISIAAGMENIRILKMFSGKIENFVKKSFYFLKNFYMIMVMVWLKETFRDG